MKLMNLLSLTAAVAILATAALPVQAQSRPEVRLPGPDQPVRNIIIENCISCHGIDDYGFFAMEREDWLELLEVKHYHQRGVVLSDGEEDILLDYLTENFGPESIPFPRNYIPVEIEVFFSTEEGRVFLDATCSECHETDRVFQRNDNLEGWRILVVNMRERGAELEDENIERLAEWLSRVRGTNQDL